MEYFFEWDPEKAHKNLQKHKISFERAIEIFYDPIALSIFDNEHSDHEDRWITIGKTKKESIIIVIHTFKKIEEDSFTIRIISARKATRKEKNQYFGKSHEKTI